MHKKKVSDRQVLAFWDLRERIIQEFSREVVEKYGEYPGGRIAILPPTDETDAMISSQVWIPFEEGCLDGQYTKCEIKKDHKGVYKVLLTIEKPLPHKDNLYANLYQS